MIEYYEDEDDDEFDEAFDLSTTDLDTADMIQDEDSINIILSGLDNDHEDIFRFSMS